MHERLPAPRLTASSNYSDPHRFSRVESAILEAIRCLLELVAGARWFELMCLGRGFGVVSEHISVEGYHGRCQ
jgi:hypothetical protein